MLCSNVHLKGERKRKVVYHRQTDGDLEKEISELRGVVYMIKRRGQEQFLVSYRHLTEEASSGVWLNLEDQTTVEVLEMIYPYE